MNAIHIILQIVGFITLCVIINYIVINYIDNNLRKQNKYLKEAKKKLQEELEAKSEEYAHKLAKEYEQFAYYRQNSNKEKQALLARISKLERELSLKRRNKH